MTVDLRVSLDYSEMTRFGRLIAKLLIRPVTQIQFAKRQNCRAFALTLYRAFPSSRRSFPQSLRSTEDVTCTTPIGPDSIVR